MLVNPAQKTLVLQTFHILGQTIIPDVNTKQSTMIWFHVFPSSFYDSAQKTLLQMLPVKCKVFSQYLKYTLRLVILVLRTGCSIKTAEFTFYFYCWKILKRGSKYTIHILRKFTKALKISKYSSIC